MRADLDTLLIAVYCAACALFPAVPASRRGRPELISDNELLCLMVAQMLLQSPSERRFLCLAHWRLRHLFPAPCPRSRATTSAAGSWCQSSFCSGKAIAAETLGATDDLRLLDTTPVPCGQSIQTTRTSDSLLGRFRLLPGPLAPLLGLQTCAAVRARRHDRRLRPRRRQHARTRSRPRTPGSQRDRRRDRHLRQRHRRHRVRDRRRSSLGALLLRPSRKDEPNRPNPPTGWIRQRIESIVDTLKDQLLLERHGGRTPAGLLARIAARILALCAAINLNQRLGLNGRSLTAYAH